MKNKCKMIAIAGLIVISGAVNSARADKTGTTLYTSAIRGTIFHCNIVNVSAKQLSVTISLVGADGGVLSVSGPAAFPAGTEASDDFSTPANPDGSPNPTDGYCKYEVSGGGPNFVRAILNAALLQTIPGTTTPIITSRVLEAH